MAGEPPASRFARRVPLLLAQKGEGTLLAPLAPPSIPLREGEGEWLAFAKGEDNPSPLMSKGELKGV